MFTSTFTKLAGGTVLLGMLLLGVPVPSGADGTPTVVINELMWMGSSASSADEWIELRNLSDVSVDLSGWQLTRRSSGVESLMLTIPSGKSIAAKGYFFIANNAPTALFGTAPNQKESPLATIPDVVDASVSLLNSGLQVKLYAGVWNAGGTLADTADDGSGNPLAGDLDSTKSLYASMERNLVPGDGTIAGSWHTATRASGWDPGAVELGTPGAANSASDPTASFSGPESATVGQSVGFDSSESIDPEGRALTVVWNFGDGTFDAGATTVHAFTAAGSFTVTCTVSNGERSATATHSLSVLEPVIAEVSAPPPNPATVELSELQAAPSSAEFVEVRNTGTSRADFSGWALADGSRRFTIPKGAAVDAGGFRIFRSADSGLHLNDDGDTVSLYDATGVFRDGIRYTKTRSGWSLIRVGSAWEWTNQPTPGATNARLAPVAPGAMQDAPEPPPLAAPPAGPSKTPGSGTTGKKVAVAIPTVSLDAVGDSARGSTVRIRGSVSALTGTVAARTFYLTDGTSGLAVYAARVPLPDLGLGDRVEVTGRVSHVQRGDRLLISKTTDVHVLGHGAAPQPTAVSASELDRDARGALVRISGTVTDVASATLTFDDGTGEATARRMKGTKVTVGDALVLTGIVVGNGESVRVLPRSATDLVLTAATAEPSLTKTSGLVPAAHAIGPNESLAVGAPKSDPTTHTLLATGIAVLLGALGVGIVKRFAPQWFDPRGRPRSSSRN